ncbi:tRNA G18 (ribose-2'-O)-methylase SpoU [Plasticicumulans lactativorans]|uniref:tRNA G18 (Ribose-2'-O)-methylase SpoU n=1 Tax=Plasticicumulans lactativorans TaxID=1133106 RepID=A0A4R2L5K4_9GAMM|nr:tRNA/rRNA methyltransferase [Plasticicumulans lactativorans]TCO81990.1 tRNA G18 (ribose-2'-O)-methylase SpoU [Plasticicumulans lactativorans]
MNRPPRRPPPPPRPPRAPRGLGADETKLYGVNACAAVLRTRPQAIVRGYFGESSAQQWGEVMRFLAAERRAYHVVPDAELPRITQSDHHGGVCLIVKRRPPQPAEAWLRAHRGDAAACVIALENVGNPHNLGAIMRVSAHFGVAGLLLTEAAALGSGSAARIAEGGAEYVDALLCDHLPDTLQAFRRAGFGIVTTSSHGGAPLYTAALPPRCVLLFGEESHGLSARLLDAGDLRVCIPGTGQVESLNVAVASGIIVGEWWRRFGA